MIHNSFELFFVFRRKRTKRKRKVFPLSVRVLSFRQGLPQAMYLPLTESAFSFTLRRKKDKKNYLPFLLRSTLLCPPTMRRKRLLFRNLTKAIYTSRFPRYKLNPVVSYSFPVRKSLWTDYIKNDFKFVRTVPVRKPL